jgi:tetratricopeptide (TPR) repeat protein
MPTVNLRWALPVGAIALVGVVMVTLIVLSQLGKLPWQSPLAQRLSDAAAQRPVDRIDRLSWDTQEVLRENPDNVDSYAMLASAYLQKARDTGDPTFYGKAESATDAALKRDPRNIEALIASGTLANARHQFREALAIGERAKALNPTVARVYGVIADAQIELGMYDDAVQTLQAMVDMRPDLGSFSRVSYARELHGDLDGAIEAMQMAVQAGGPATENSAWVRVQLGNLYFAKNDLPAAEQQYQATLAILPDYVYGLAGMARVRAAQGHADQAVALYQRAIARMPLPEFVIGLGELQEANGRTADAAKQYELVRAMQQLFKANGVDTDLELALFDADHPAAELKAGGSDPAATVALARAAYERRPSVKGADTLAWALFKAGQAAEARHYADQALHLNTQDALMLYHAGMIAQAQGDAAAARNWLNRALTLNPHFSPLFAPQAQQALAQLNAAASK